MRRYLITNIVILQYYILYLRRYNAHTDHLDLIKCLL